MNNRSSPLWVIAFFYPRIRTNSLWGAHAKCFLICVPSPSCTGKGFSVSSKASQCLLRLLSVFWEAFQTFIAASILIWPVARKLGTYGSWAEGGNCLPVLFHGIIIMIVTWKVNKLCFRFFFYFFFYHQIYIHVYWENFNRR